MMRVVISENLGKHTTDLERRRIADLVDAVIDDSG